MSVGVRVEVDAETTSNKVELNKMFDLERGSPRRRTDMQKFPNAKLITAFLQTTMAVGASGVASLVAS